MMQRNDFAAERLERLSVFSFTMQRNDRNDSHNLPSEPTGQYYAAHIDLWLTTNYLKFPITCVGSSAFHALWIELQFTHDMHYNAVLTGQ